MPFVPSPHEWPAFNKVHFSTQYFVNGYNLTYVFILNQECYVSRFSEENVIY